MHEMPVNNNAVVKETDEVELEKLIKPKRPLSAYNFFFRAKRSSLVAEKEAKSKTEVDITPVDADSKKGKDSVKEDKDSVTEDKESVIEDKESIQEEKEAADPDTKPRRKRGRPRGPNYCRKNPPHGKISFEELGKTIGSTWKEISVEELAHYQELAEKDRQRYQNDKIAYESKLKVREKMEKERKKAQAEKLPLDVSYNQEDVYYHQHEHQSQPNSWQPYHQPYTHPSNDKYMPYR